MSESPFPSTGRLAGIDFGEVRVGIAVSDPGRIIASPWETYTRRNAQVDAEYFRQFVAQERIVGFVVGLPVHMSGEESPKSREARNFAQWLGEVTGLPICFQDERYSTAEANRQLADAHSGRKQKKQRRDMLAAQMILTGFLEASSRGPPGPLDK